jgi:hypothetical protein
MWNIQIVIKKYPFTRPESVKPRPAYRVSLEEVLEQQKLRGKLFKPSQNQA